ncbi:MAG: ABC transporter substrate-binding protein [Deltaproteobacteria bacterium]|nr:ABC transporter substrate-binding protein [Deltaproteobacteria bacterium]MBI4795519.1 ABC transporter substrate-binding protein [Deltaproteobacteria bacterium]
MRLVLIGVLALSLTLSLALAVSGARAESPTDAVKSVVDEAIRILKDPSLKAPALKKQRRDRVKQVVDRRFDYEEMAKRSLGASWRSLSAGQRQEFVRLFAQLLEASYSDKIMNYSDEKVQYAPEIKDDDDYAEVRTMVLRKNDRIPMNYRLMRKSQGWMVYDVVIEGVSLVSNYRSQFSQVIRESSYNELVRRLRTKINELQRIERI